MNRLQRHCEELKKKYDFIFIDWRTLNLNHDSAAQSLRNKLKLNAKKLIVIAPCENKALNESLLGFGSNTYKVLIKPIIKSTLHNVLLQIMHIKTLKKPESQESLNTQNTLQKLQGIHILLVEESPSGYLIGSMSLSGDGYNINCLIGSIGYDIRKPKIGEFKPDENSFNAVRQVFEAYATDKEFREKSKEKYNIFIFYSEKYNYSTNMTDMEPKKKKRLKAKELLALSALLGWVEVEVATTRRMVMGRRGKRETTQKRNPKCPARTTRCANAR